MSILEIYLGTLGAFLTISVLNAVMIAYQKRKLMKQQQVLNNIAKQHQGIVMKQPTLQ